MAQLPFKSIALYTHSSHQKFDILSRLFMPHTPHTLPRKPHARIFSQPRLRHLNHPLKPRATISTRARPPRPYTLRTQRRHDVWVRAVVAAAAPPSDARALGVRGAHAPGLHFSDYLCCAPPARLPHPARH